MLSRRTFLQHSLLAPVVGTTVISAFPELADAATSPAFNQWRERLRTKAAARGVSEATFSRVMNGLEPDMRAVAEMSDQPEFNQPVWQYINRRVSDWRMSAGKETLAKHGALFARIEKDFGVARGTLLALWGVETSYGDPQVQKSFMRPVFPSLAALAFAAPRRRDYFETELVNALRIVERGWGTPEEMQGSWAGAMGHTQWMPEVWLNVGMDYDGDGRVSPFGKPDDALGSSARYLLKRGKYRAGEHWGYEVRTNGVTAKGNRSYESWANAGVVRADGQPFRQPKASAQLWTPVPGGPSFLLGQNFYAVRSYNPSMNYALAIVHLGDRILGGGPFRQAFPGSERAMTLAEIQEMQTRLTRAGYDTKGTDGRVGNGTMTAVRNYQLKHGIDPADGYGGLALLARLRQGG